MNKKLPDHSYFPDTPFIVCRRRKSQPKISPLICEKRCPRMKNCQEYFDYLQPAMFGKCEKRDAREKPDLNRLTEKKDSRRDPP